MDRQTQADHECQDDVVDAAPSAHAFVAPDETARQSNGRRRSKPSQKESTAQTKTKNQPLHSWTIGFFVVMLTIFLVNFIFWPGSWTVGVASATPIILIFLVWISTKIDYSERPIPTEGRPKSRYGFYKAVYGGLRLIPSYKSLATPIPNLSKNERARLVREEEARDEQRQIELREEGEAELARQADEAYEGERDELIERINTRLKVDKLRVVIAVSNQNGGGSKTSTTNQAACAVADVTRLPVAVMETRRDSALGMEALGVLVEETLTLRQLYARRAEVTNANALYGLLSSNKYGVLGVAADTNVPDDDDFDGNKGGELVRLVSNQVPVVFLDTGNLPTEDINVGMVKEAHVGMFPTLPSHVSVKLCRLTKQAYERRPELAHVARHSIFVVNALHDDQQPEDFREDLETSERSEVHGTPYDRYVDDTVDPKINKVVDRSRNRPDTNLAILRYVAAILDVAYVASQEATSITPAPATASHTEGQAS